jgi:hypothetical protein
MSPANLSPADALLRLRILAAITIAGLYGWLGWRMRDWPADLPAPQPLRAVEISEFMILFVFVPAAVVVALRWRATRDRPLAALAYAGLAMWSFIAWNSMFEDGAALAGEVLRLRFADAAIALAGVPVAIRALRLG